MRALARRLAIVAALLAVLAACAPPPLELQARPVPGGVEITANAPLDRVALERADGTPVASRTLPSPAREAMLLAPWEGGVRYRVLARAGGRRATTVLDTPSLGPVRVELAAPLGQERRPVEDGGHYEVTLLGGAQVEAALILTAVQPGPVTVRWGELAHTVELGVAGETATVRRPLRAGSAVPVVVDAGGERLRALLDPVALPMGVARGRLTVEEVRLPVDARGRPDSSRPADRIALPAPWWSDLLRSLRLGWRARDDQAPWTHQAVVLANRGARPLDVAVSARVLGDDGEPVRAFRSRVRGASSPDGAVHALLRVPPGERARAVLPVFVERSQVEEGTWTRAIEVAPLGASQPLHQVREPLYVTEGSSWASGGFLAALLASSSGLLFLAWRGRRWLRELHTGHLVTIALFGTLTFVVAAASRLLGYGVASVLGPFAPLLTGLVDDAFRTCLLAALIVLIPRVGVVTLASLVGYLMRGLALGSFHPADLLYFGSVVFFLEGCLWLVGLTRDPAWRDEGWWARWLRLSLGFGVANALAVAAGLVVSVVLYRLFLADWYVVLVVALPGFLYVVIGCAIAVDFAESLRRIAR